MDGITSVQARIAQIQGQFAAMHVSAAGPGASLATRMDAAAGPSFAEELTRVQSQTTTQQPDAATGVRETAGAPAASAGAKVVAEAKKYLGIPYQWGGTNPASGLDCSGLTQLVYKNLGYDIPRVSSDQAKAGRAVDGLANARPGDLVFYDNSSSRAGIDHVAIYIGDGKIIEAPRTGLNVRITDVGDPVSIRRILPDAAPQTAARVQAPAAAAGTAGASGASGAGGLAGVPYANLFTKAGAQHGVPASLLAAVAKTESAFNPNAVSHAGARGLMQFMPGTAADLGINPMDPAQAVDGAARYLGQQIRAFGTVEVALAAYNAGPGAVRKHGGIPPYAETQNYVRKVMGTWEDYR